MLDLNRRRLLRPGALLMTLAAGAACSSTGPGVACDPVAVDGGFVGSWTRSDQRLDLNLVGEQDLQTVSAQTLSLLAEVLGQGADTGPSSVVWGMNGQGTSDGLLLIQLGGTRRAGVALPILGAIATVLPWGQAPVISGLVKDGAFILFLTDDYRAAQASGTIQVTSVHPFRGTLDAAMTSPGGVTAHILGQLTFQVHGPGC